MKTAKIHEKNWPAGKIFHADCREVLPRLEPNSVDLILTDPPYFIDGMGEDWDRSKLETKVNKAGIIGGRPIGMKFDMSQGYSFQEFLTPIFKESFRVLKPGGFLISFSQARLFHRLAVAAEDEGFEIRFAFFSPTPSKSRVRILEGRLRRLQEKAEMLRVELERSPSGIDKYLEEWRRHSLESAMREVAWLEDMIKTERK